MRRASLRNALPISVLLLGLQAGAQPVVGPFTGIAQVSVLADDNGPVGTDEFDKLTSSLFASDAGPVNLFRCSVAVGL